MQDLLLLLATVAFLAVGCLVPFVMSLGYVWVDVFTPHLISASLLNGLPIAFIMGAGAVITYLAMDRKSPPKFTAITMVQILLCLWITLTTQWALVPVSAAARWDLSIKVAAFATFLPYVIRTRAQIEALVLIYLFSIAAHILPWGLKTVLSGGGYGMSLGLSSSSGNVLQESSTLSGVCVMIVPLILTMRKHSVLLPKGRLRDVGMLGLALMGPVAAIGTFARTALVAFAVTGIAMWLRSKHKMGFLVGTAVLGAILFGVTSDRWTTRIDTIADYQSESSAYVRILVWRWALDFLPSHPFGGGFWVWMTNRIEVPSPDGTAIAVQYGRAFHNVFIALLAEHGYIGFGLYVGMLLLSMLALHKTQRLTHDSEEHGWCGDLAKALQVAIATIYAAGMFVEIGWTPLVWYLVSMSVCVREYARRACEAKPQTVADRVRLAPRPAMIDRGGAPAFRKTTSPTNGGW